MKQRIRNRVHGSPTAVGLVSLAAAAAARAAGGGEGGLVLVPDFTGVLPGLFVLFILLVWPLNRLIFQPLFRVLEERDDQIRGTRERAEAVATQADEVLERYQGALAEVREEAETERRRRIEEARAAHLASTSGARGESEREVTRAREEVAAALVESRSSLRAQSEALARIIAGRVLGRELS